jgi:hypothetical protein
MAKKYLVFTTEEEGEQRAFAEGQRLNLYFHRGLPDSDKGSKYLTFPRETSNGKFALDVSDYELTSSEQSKAVSSVTFPSFGNNG